MSLGQDVRARIALHHCAAVGEHPSVNGRVWVHGAGLVHVGDRVRFDARDGPIELYAERGAEIRIGDDAVIRSGTSIEARRAITIGPRVCIEPDCKVLDCHLHALDQPMAIPEPRPVVVEAGVRLGPRAILLAGAHIPEGAAVAGGTVVRGERTRRPSSDAPVAAAVPPSRARSVLAGAARLIRLATASLRGRFFVRGVQRGGRLYAHGPVRVENQGTIRLGDRVVFVRGMVPTRLRCRPGATLEVGAGTTFGHGAVVEAHQAVRIGRGCMVASSVRLCDAGDRGVSPIVVGDGVWLAHGVVIEPGVTIGSGSVVSAGSVVRRDVPDRSLAMGNPARSVSLDLAGRPA